MDENAPDPLAPQGEKSLSDPESSRSVLGENTGIDTDIAAGDKGKEGEPATSEAAKKKDSGGAKRRIGGLAALLLGTIGALASLAGVGLGLRVLFLAGDTAASAMAPVVEAVDRMDTRIDQTDDALSSRGVPTGQIEELRARAQGLADLTNSANANFDRVNEHPVYRFFPGILDDLGADLGDYQETSEVLNDRVLNAPTLSSTEAGVLSSEINDLQGNVNATRDLVESTQDSLVGWIRLSGLAGFLVGLWSFWAQLILARRGWRGLAGRRF